MLGIAMVMKESAKVFLKENASIAYEIEDKIRAAHGLDFEIPDSLQNSEDVVIEA